MQERPWKQRWQRFPHPVLTFFIQNWRLSTSGVTYTKSSQDSIQLLICLFNISNTSSAWTASTKGNDGKIITRKILPGQSNLEGWPKHCQLLDCSWEKILDNTMKTWFPTSYLMVCCNVVDKRKCKLGKFWCASKQDKMRSQLSAHFKTFFSAHSTYFNFSQQKSTII